MGSKLHDVVEREDGFFQLDSKWRPHNLLFELQIKELMTDMQRRLEGLQSAREEIQKLPRGPQVLKVVRKLGFIHRRASFMRHSNHLAFVQAVSEFYTAFGQVFRYLKIEQAKGQLQPA